MNRDDPLSGRPQAGISDDDFGELRVRMEQALNLLGSLTEAIDNDGMKIGMQFPATYSFAVGVLQGFKGDAKPGLRRHSSGLPARVPDHNSYNSGFRAGKRMDDLTNQD